MKYLAFAISAIQFACAGALIHLLSESWIVGSVMMLAIFAGVIWFIVALKEMSKEK